MPNEGAFFLPQLQNMTLNLILFRATMKVYASTDFDADKDKERIQMVQDALEFQYTPWGETADPLKLRQGVVDLTGDSWFVAPSVQVCKEHSAHAQTFLFEVNYRPSFALSAKWMGATHGDNIWLDFGPPFFDSPPYNADDKNVSLLVMNMYTNFAKLGIPTPEPLFNGMKWTAFNSTNLAYLRIQPDPDMKNNLLPHRMAFWNHYHPQLVKSARQCNSTDNSGVKSGAGSTCPSFAITLFMIFGLCFMFSVLRDEPKAKWLGVQAKISYQFFCTFYLVCRNLFWTSIWTGFFFSFTPFRNFLPFNVIILPCSNFLFDYWFSVVIWSAMVFEVICNLYWFSVGIWNDVKIVLI